jgi:NTP pyrophosphatase (non-canonical NTP hydrolase)
MQSEVVAFVKSKGWNDDRTFGDSIALLHSEASEALEAYRLWGLDDQTYKTDYPLVESPEGNWVSKPEGVGSEFADVLIRLLDNCERYNVDLIFEFKRKMEYNRTREYRHGGKKL